MAKKIDRKEVFGLIDEIIKYLDSREKKTRNAIYNKATCRDVINKLDEFRQAHETPAHNDSVGGSCMDRAPRDGTIIKVLPKGRTEYVRVQFDGYTYPPRGGPSMWTTTDSVESFYDTHISSWRKIDADGEYVEPQPMPRISKKTGRKMARKRLKILIGFLEYRQKMKSMYSFDRHFCGALKRVH